VKYIKDQHSAYLRKELTAMRDRYIQDTRIHCCLYFINPTGHSLRPIDVTVMKKLSEVVNVVPVIAKADSLTLEERESFKQKVSTASIKWRGDVADQLYQPDYRSGQSSSITVSASIRLIQTSMMKRRCSSMRAFVYVSVLVSDRYCLSALTWVRAQNMIPFAVVGSESNVIIGGKAVRGRKNRWGVVNVEDETHCEFVSLRNFLTR